MCTLLAAPKAGRLFQRATIQSAYCSLSERPLAEAQAEGAAFANNAGCTDAATTLACLWSAEAANLVAAFQTAGSAGPVIGTPTLPVGSAEAITSNSWNKVLVIIGGVAHEGKLLLRHAEA